MGKSVADAHRRELGTYTKPEIRKEDNETEIYDKGIPEGGCWWWGNVQEMRVRCPRCVEKNCY
jgi:hypothetical protein